ncbi:MAG: hypothetical protein DHS80DRAFT_27428 [Piptocephalis tieghemiana]|nr:MAG: hypothetical protein DHS80DRAFT_27428 [Piptocephalis tieghemiana]
MSSPITSVAPTGAYSASTQSLDVALPPVLTLDLRGTRETIEREVLINLPESLLVVMFPNGLVFGPGSHISHYSDYASEDEEVVYVDLDPSLLRYVLDFYDSAIHDRETAEASSPSPSLSPHWTSPFPDKTALIVLREELDYYPILPASSYPPHLQVKPTSPSSSLSGFSSPSITEKRHQWVSEMKRICGDHLVRRRRVFDALRRSQPPKTSSSSPEDSEANPEVLTNGHSHTPDQDPSSFHSDPPLTSDREGSNAAEQQLIDMLCLAGFSISDQWGHRAREPHRCSVVSIALVRLVSTGKPAQMAAVQKLLLFWRKPARKCWWDGVLAEVPSPSSLTPPSSSSSSTTSSSPPSTTSVRLWARRTWTLELALV